MVSRFLRPLFSWGQEAFRVTPFAVAASARSSLITSLTSYQQNQQAQGPHAHAHAHAHTQHPMQQQQRRHRWAGVGDFGGSETAAMEHLNDGAQYEGLVKRWNARKYYIKPYVERKRRYDRWVRRRSVQKIQNLLARVRYDKARMKDAYPALTGIFSSEKDGPQKWKE